MSTSGSSHVRIGDRRAPRAEAPECQARWDLPLDEFVGDDPFENHPLFKTEEDARREEEETGEHPAVALEIPAETLEIPVVEAARGRGAARAPQGWMETTASQEFSWE